MIEKKDAQKGAMVKVLGKSIGTQTKPIEEFVKLWFSKSMPMIESIDGDPWNGSGAIWINGFMFLPKDLELLKEAGK